MSGPFGSFLLDHDVGEEAIFKRAAVKGRQLSSGNVIRDSGTFVSVAIAGNNGVHKHLVGERAHDFADISVEETTLSPA